MGFIKHALIGIALYEGIKYVLRQQDHTTDSQAAFYEMELEAVEDDPWKNSLANDELRAPDS